MSSGRSTSRNHSTTVFPTLPRILKRKRKLANKFVYNAKMRMAGELRQEAGDVDHEEKKMDKPIQVKEEMGVDPQVEEEDPKAIKELILSTRETLKVQQKKKHDLFQILKKILRAENAAREISRLNSGEPPEQSSTAFAPRNPTQFMKPRPFMQSPSIPR